ncbi:MAG: hypothetical protein HYZ28_15260 [Myxococcales bacterium]|nr:hypothetical protein [Myxococcales bacterium]
MSINSDFRDLLRELNAAEARYLVVGAYAVIFHSEPRFTKDADVWVEATQDNAQRVWRALAAFGAPLDDLTIDDLSRPGIVFQMGLPPNRIDLVTSIEAVEFGPAWSRRVETSYGGARMWVIGIDDLIVNKRALGRLQDQLDLPKLEKARR